MKRERYLDEHGNFQFVEISEPTPELNSKKAEKPLDLPKEQGEKAVEVPENLEELLIVELRAIAKSLNVKFNKKTNKTELIDGIRKSSN